MSSDCEVQVGNDIFVFATPGMAGLFSACLSTNGTIAKCKLKFPPIGERKVLVASSVEDENDDDQDPDEEMIERRRRILRPRL